ncbi:molybdenum cofactor biosynthesis protein MoaE [Aquimarina brevivitae]|uniref:Molybdopterin synthase catalytic subunit n=1 Tax=Aquimarina brevivitae TaxID=323412 RepID=A0A4Q7NZP3_9FLAO|nr:molybdenum cofactor biosynthesis protein MoaE [Aquimarina brevivitae]RZS92530.1 molybdopterin synthase catalytic subunit [Aquimarina brevivitae]
MKKIKSVFVNGPIPPEFIANSIAKHQSKTAIGAHNIFLGQIRADQQNNKEVKAINYTAYEDMANEVMYTIREETFEKFDLSCMHIYHSLGTVYQGEICLFVFVSAPHRKVTFEAIEYLVERIKKEAPIYGKEIFSDESHQWKVNT